MLIKNIHFRYIVAGIVNTIFGYSMFALFVFLKFHYSLAVLMSTIFGIIFNFVNFGSFVFKSKPWNKLHKFVLVYFFLYLLNIFGLYVFVNLLSMNIYFSNAMLIIMIAGIGFLLSRKFVYS